MDTRHERALKKKLSINKKIFFFIFPLLSISTQFLLKCPQGCEICSQLEKNKKKIVCLQCEIAHKLTNKSCTECRVNYCKVCNHDIESCTDCLSGYYRKKNSNSIKEFYTCQKCPENCLNCKSSKRCEKCYTLYKKQGEACVIDKRSLFFISLGGFLIGFLFMKCVCSITDAYNSESSDESQNESIERRGRSILLTAGKKKKKKKKILEGKNSKEILEKKFQKNAHVMFEKRRSMSEEEIEKEAPPLSSQRMPFNDIDCSLSIKSGIENRDIKRLKFEEGELMMKKSKGSFSFGGDLNNRVNVIPRNVKDDNVDSDGEEEKKEI